MDGAGFTHTDPPEDPDSIVGEAGIVAHDDYLKVRPGTQSLRIAPLVNDLLPEGAEALSLKLVSATARGASVSISDDGTHLIYTAGEGGFQGSDSFYYIVQTEDGELGKANVNLSRKVVSGGSSHTSTPSPIRIRFGVLEDSGEQLHNVFSQDARLRRIEGGQIVSISRSNLGATMRIADDGRSIHYQPPAATIGNDYFTLVIRDDAGEESSYSARVDIDKPYSIQPRHDSGSIDSAAGSMILDPLANDRLLGPTPITPRIDSFTAPDHAGKFTLLEDGRRILFEPAADFLGQVKIQYTVRYGEADHQTVSGSFSTSVSQAYQSVENWFAVEPNINEPVELDVLANDLNYRTGTYWRNAHYLPPIGPVTLKLVGVSAGSDGGGIRLAPDGQSLLYQPASGFQGDETFEYTVEGSNGLRQTARVTIHVAEQQTDSSGVARFATEGELNQYLIDRAVARWQGQFGQFRERYADPPEGWPVPTNQLYFDALNAAGDSEGTLATNRLDHSETNTQVAGVDEADIVETDGRYVYTFTDGQLAIVDLIDPTSPTLVSLTSFEASYDKMYLQGDRVTLLRTGNLYGTDAEVVVLDVLDRTDPAIAERTEIDGYIADSRAIGDRVHLVVKRNFTFPELEGEWIIDPLPPAGWSIDQPRTTNVVSSSSDALFIGNAVDYYYPRGEAGIWQNETLNEYLDRVRDDLIETALPTYRTFDAEGALVASGLFTDGTDLHKAIAGEDLIISLVTLDVGDETPGPITDATSFIADDQTEVFVSATATYLFAYDYATDATTIHKMSFADDGTAPLVATGTIRGRLLNQFSADEFDGPLRIATTQQERQPLSNGRWRQSRLFNNVLTLQQNGNQLEVIGEITNLAPTETIHSVRFMGERAYVVTFRLVDPLFAIDLSDPTTPTVEGALKIPGFSNYLHPVGTDHLIGIGRDADEITGRLGPLQITLFNVADLSNPHVADQLTFEGAQWVNSEAWIDHHAVAYFAESGVLTLPIRWSERVDPDDPSNYATTNHAAMFTFAVEVNDEGATIEKTGQIEHPTTEPFENPPFIQPGQGGLNTVALRLPYYQQTASPPRRALRIGGSLITVSNDWVQVHNLNDPSEQLGESYLGPPARNDQFNTTEESGTQLLDVLTNDYPGANGQVASIISVEGPATGAVVTIADDGRSVSFTPEENFLGTATFTYTIDDPLRGEQTATVRVYVENTLDDPDAIDDTFNVAIDAEATTLDVLANDLNPDYNGLFFQPYFIDCDCGSISLSSDYVRYPRGIQNGLRVVELRETDAGGTIELNDYGQLIYQPAAGYEGFETFTYTIENHVGTRGTATVEVAVGNPRHAVRPVTRGRFIEAEITDGDEPDDDIATRFSTLTTRPLYRPSSRVSNFEPTARASDTATDAALLLLTSSATDDPTRDQEASSWLDRDEESKSHEEASSSLNDPLETDTIFALGL